MVTAAGRVPRVTLQSTVISLPSSPTRYMPLPTLPTGSSVNEGATTKNVD